MIKELKRKENGQAIVEMALVLPIFLLLLFGIFEMSIIGYTYISLNNAARAGARVASVGGSDLDITTTIQNAVVLNNSSLTINITPPENQRQSGQDVTVNVSYPVQIIVPLLGGILPNPYIVNADLTMRIE